MFTDDNSKFTNVYILKRMSKVFMVYHDFQTLVDRWFDQKIIVVQTN
jgi:hypothetical protein